MKTKQFILFFMALMSYMSALAYDHEWTDANGTLWTFNISGSNATLFNLYYEDDGDYKPCISGTIPQNLIIPSQVYVNGTPYTVTAIGNGAFYECRDVKTIIIPDGVTSIGYDAFWGSGITSINIPEGVTNIKTYTFYGCEHLTSVTIPGSVTWIGQGAFEHCDNITSVTVNALIPPSTTENPYITYAQLFDYCYSKATLYVPYSCKAAYEAAKEWKAFKEIVEMDQASSFITFVDSHVKLDCLANWDTNSDGKLSMAEAAAVTSIGTVFRNSQFITSFDELQYFTNVTSIEDEAFYGCSDLTSITLPKGVTSIGRKAFWGCSDLTSIIIPEDVTSIGTYAFEDCSNLASITIPNSVTSVGNSAFEYTAWYDNQPDGLVYVGRVVYRYKGTMPEETNIVIEDGIISIADYAFNGCTGLTSINIPNSVTSLSGFSGCTGLTTINIPESVTRIGGSAFSGCSGLISIVIPEGVTSIGGNAFYGCSNLASITIPNSVTSVGTLAFKGTAWYNNLPDGLVYIGKVVYGYKGTMPNGTEITINEGTINIIFGAFLNCSGLTSIAIPNSVTWIGGSAFSGCRGLTSISIPNSVTSIESGTFEDCRNLTSIIIPNSVTSIASEAFSGCSNLTSITIPNSVTSIGSDAFNYCYNLISVTINTESPVGFSTVDGTFYNRANVTLYVPYGSKAIYEATNNYWKQFKEIVEMTPVQVGSTGFATFCSPFALDFSSVTEIKAYIASGFNPSTGTLVLTRVTEVPAGEGLYIVGDEGSYNVPATTTDMVYSNLLKGVTTATTISPTDGDYTNFILANGSHGVGFYTLSAAGELAGGKAYLQLPTASVAGVKAISFVFNDGDETGISEVKDVPSVEGIYNLQGQRISQPRKGLNIINGKKVIIK